MRLHFENICVYRFSVSSSKLARNCNIAAVHVCLCVCAYVLPLRLFDDVITWFSTKYECQVVCRVLVQKGDSYRLV